MRWLILVLLLIGMPALGQSLESALMPGAVIKGHAEAENECGKCHVRGDRAAQPGLCLACHKAVAADVKAERGYHGRLKDRTCRNCHTEHKGREARIVKLDTGHFDHGQTDFSLRGKHQGKACSSCHRSGESWRKAPPECVACHRKDDKHKGGLGDKCGNCHQETAWKDAHFDHGKTKFPLRLSHLNTACADCHREQRYTNTAKECVSCHRKDDAHKGRYGNACAKCHDEGKWKRPTFRHDLDTLFPLLDKHSEVKCESCHRNAPLREKTASRCVDCHRSDDAHMGRLGDKCEKCHSAKGWQKTRFDHDLDTKFPLRDKHAKAKCESCHKAEARTDGKPGKVFGATPSDCYSCHGKDDKDKGHKGAFGRKCETCHDESGFKSGHFDHGGKTQFKLMGKHQKAKCNACHRMPLYDNKTDKSCIACHKNDDIHFASYGTDCERCHVAENWRKVIKQDATGKEGQP